MNLLKPHCPACHRILDGQLVASSCNHVFHRACLPAIDDPCPKCQQPDAGKHALDLFGLGFTEGLGDITATLPPEAREEAAKIFALEQNVAEKRRNVDAQCQKLEAAKKDADAEQAKLKGDEKSLLGRKSKAEKFKSELENVQSKHAKLSEQANRHREQATIFEYCELLQNPPGVGADALSFLRGMVNVVSDPAILLTEIARLRDHHRNKTAKQQKEGVQMSQLESRYRRQIAEKQRLIAELKKKTHRYEQQLVRRRSESMDEALPMEKRPRVSA